jgi:PPK2 family polyphosphate:nucleotide phosphotransferase
LEAGCLLIDAEKAFRAPIGERIVLKDWASAWLPSWVDRDSEKSGKDAVKKSALAVLDVNRKKLVEMQELFWASDTYAMLVILQGMDASGKDGVIRHVMSGVNPQGCQVTSFKTPSEEEQDHDFLWRYSKALPERGRIGIFNRSYYEDVLIVKVRPEVFEKQKLPQELEGDMFWAHRYEDINLFERHLVRNGTLILKFFLNISKGEQKQRLIKRLEQPDKHWKFSFSDLAERSKWAEYMDAYQDMLNHTSTEWAPWYIIPADKKWVARASISEIIVSKIMQLNLKFPASTHEQILSFEKAKSELMGQ